MAIIIDGQKHGLAIRAEVKEAAKGKNCTLAVVLVGDDPASLVYIGMKKKACEEAGIGFELHRLPEAASEDEVLALIDGLNANNAITGILVQQPFPSRLNKEKILTRLDHRKDVDCLHPYNVGLALAGRAANSANMQSRPSDDSKPDTVQLPRLLPCTPAGCITLLKREGIEISGKQAVVIGRSDIVGKPLALMLMAENATVTICHSRTKDLPEVCRRADILVAAIGRPRFVTADMVKDGAVVIDVGVNRLEGKKICGDVDYDAVSQKASYITPVPRGVGPMTVATLMENCVKAWELLRV